MSNPHYTEQDKKIARDILLLAKDHELSWNGQKYELGNFKQLVHAYLQKIQPQTAASILLNSFAVQWSNDLLDFCHCVINDTTYN